MRNRFVPKLKTFPNGPNQMAEIQSLPGLLDSRILKSIHLVELVPATALFRC